MFEKTNETKLNIETDVKLNGLIFDRYTFKTKSGNEYEVDFIKRKLKLFYAPEVAKITGKKSIEGIDVNFTTVDGTNKYFDPMYLRRTGLNESIEVFGKILHAVKTHVNRNKHIGVYLIGKDTAFFHQFYTTIFKNIFSQVSVMVEDGAEFYKTGAIYYIRTHKKSII